MNITNVHQVNDEHKRGTQPDERKATCSSGLTNLTYVRQPRGTDEPKTLTFVGSTWLTNVRHIGPRRPWCHVKDFFKKIYFVCLPGRGAYKTGTQYTIYKQQQTHIQYTTIQHVKHHKYWSNTTATHQYPNITSPRMQRSSLRRVVVLHPSTACVDHCLGELFSLRGIMLCVWNLQDIDTNMLDDHKSCEIQWKF
jgi:hypothetical protein